MNAAEQMAAQMASGKVFEDYLYLNSKYGSYVLEIQAVKATNAGNPCIEAKVIEAKKTHENEPFRVGDVVSHVEKLQPAKNGGAGRAIKALLAMRDMAPSEIATAEYTRSDGAKVVAQGDAAQLYWLVKFLNQEKQPCAFLRVRCDVEPREGKGDAKGKFFSRERWSAVELDEKTLDEIEAKRAAAKLPNLEDAMK
jgi:hypothetical protein